MVDPFDLFLGGIEDKAIAEGRGRVNSAEDHDLVWTDWRHKGVVALGDLVGAFVQLDVLPDIRTLVNAKFRQIMATEAFASI